MPSHPARLAARLVMAGVLLAGCGGGGPATIPLGQEAVVEHANVSPGTGPTTTLGVTALAVRTGTMAELEDGGFEVDPEDQEKTPTYVDVRYVNKGSQAIDRELRVSMEDADGNLISPVVVFNYGNLVYEPCPDNTEGELAPGDSFDSCVLFFVGRSTKAARVSFLPHVPGKETDWVYWAIP